MRSSYVINNYGYVFNSIVLAHKPLMVVECGVLDGYSTINIADALKFNNEQRGIYSKFYAYDLWENYPYNHGDIKEVYNRLIEMGVEDYVKLCYGNAFEVYESFKDSSIDLLHVDISNDGNTLSKIIDLWGNKINEGGIILFEGGSKDRDRVEWMMKYDKKAIRPELEKIIKKGWKVKIFDLHPSLTMIFKD